MRAEVRYPRQMVGPVENRQSPRGVYRGCKGGRVVWVGGWPRKMHFDVHSVCVVCAGGGVYLILIET